MPRTPDSGPPPGPAPVEPPVVEPPGVDPGGGGAPAARGRSARAPRAALWAWAGLVGLALTAQLASRPLFDPDEGRNAEVMREMAISGDFLVPRLNGLLFLDKPFVFFAAGALPMKLLGASELAARLPGLAATLAMALLIAAAARRWWGRRAGWLAGLAMLTAPLPLVYSQIVIFDALLGLWIALAAIALYRAVEDEPGDSRIPWSHLAWAAMALGTLTKGPVALLVPLAAAIPWALWRRRGSRLWRRGAPLVWIALVAPWVAWVSRYDPGFVHYVLVTESWSRMTSAALHRDAAFWYYLPYLLVGALPWSLVVACALPELRRAWRRRDPTIRFLLAWLVVPLVIFSAIHSKRPHYILPLVPAVVLLGVWVWERQPAGRPLPGVRAAGLTWSALGGLVALAGSGWLGRLSPARYGLEPATVARVALAVGGGFVVAGALAVFARRAPLAAACALSLPAVALLLLTAPLTTAVGRQRSTRDLAAAIRGRYPDGIEVVGVESFPASLPFYLGRTITLASEDARTLRSNYILSRYPEMIDRHATLRSPAWLDRALADCGADRLFVVADFRDEQRRALRDTGHPQLGAAGDYVRYGPCATYAAVPSGETAERE